MGAIGDMNAYMQFKAAQSMQDAAKQEGGAAGQGMGLGLGLGLRTDDGRRGWWRARSRFRAAQTDRTCAKCGTHNPIGAKFCSNCGATQQAATSRYCRVSVLPRANPGRYKILRKLRNVTCAPAVQELPGACSARRKILRELWHPRVIISVGLGRPSL